MIQAAGLRAGQVIGAIVTLLAALLIAFLFGWKLALLLVIAVPFIAGASYQQMMILRRNQRRDAELMNDAARVSTLTEVKISKNGHTFFETTCFFCRWHQRVL